MIIHTMPQRSPEWHQARCGRLTASCAGEMMAVVKTGEAAARRDLRLRLVLEQLTGVVQEDGFTNAAIQRGIDQEGPAIGRYEALTGLMARPVGFVAHDELMAGCSPDGYIGDFEGILEIKNPKSATHLGYLRSKTVPRDYLLQITHALWITGAQWADFLSCDDRMPEGLQVFHKRVERHEVDLAAYEIAVRGFLKEVERELDEVRGMYE